jgi:hypothetical protein
VGFAEQASRSNKFAILWATDYTIRLFLDLEGYLKMLALRVTWPSFGNTTVSACILIPTNPKFLSIRYSLPGEGNRKSVGVVP